MSEILGYFDSDPPIGRDFRFQPRFSVTPDGAVKVTLYSPITRASFDDNPITTLHDGAVRFVSEDVFRVGTVEIAAINQFIKWTLPASGIDFGGIFEFVTQLPDLPVTTGGLAEKASLARESNKPELVRYLNRFIRAYRDGNEDAAEAWITCLLQGLKAERRWLPKVKGKLKSEAALTPEQRLAGSQANKANADARKALLDKAIIDYRDNCPNALRPGGPEACLRVLVEGGLLNGLSPSTVFQRRIKPLFAKKRAELKAEK